MNFLSIDNHLAVSGDIRHIFNNLGHTVRELNLSGHNRLVGRIQANIPELNGDSWCSTIQGRKQDEFYNKYKDYLEQFDAFICCYPPVYSTLYKKSNKPIIIDIPIRYEHGVQNDVDLWNEFNDFLREGTDSGRITLVANNLYDAKYAEGFIQRPVLHIPSLCEYTGMSYNPIHDQFIYYASMRIVDKSGRLIKKHDALRGGHSWQDVAQYRGCFHLPYNISTMSTFEQYTANIPLFFPSQRLLLKMYTENLNVLDQISWNRADNRKPGSLIPGIHEHDPNDYINMESMRYWLQFADPYNTEWMGNIQYFDNDDDIDRCLSLTKAELHEISAKMRAENVVRKHAIYRLWESVLMEVSR